jgi:excisionase family DNA binding protein
LKNSGQLELVPLATDLAHATKSAHPLKRTAAAAQQAPRARAHGSNMSRPSAVVRVTLTVDEAAAALGVSRDHLERHILRDLHVIYSGRRRLIPVRELERWAERHALAIPAPPRRP